MSKADPLFPISLALSIREDSEHPDCYAACLTRNGKALFYRTVGTRPGAYAALGSILQGLAFELMKEAAVDAGVSWDEIVDGPAPEDPVENAELDRLLEKYAPPIRGDDG